MNERREWRCEECRLLLGVKTARKVEVVYKEVQVVVCGDGTVSTVCRRCGKLNAARVA